MADGLEYRDEELPALHQEALRHLLALERLLDRMPFPDARGPQVPASHYHQRSLRAIAGSIRQHALQLTGSRPVPALASLVTFGDLARLHDVMAGKSEGMATNKPTSPDKNEGGDMPRRSVPAGDRVTDSTLESMERGLEHAIPEPEDEGSSMAERAQEVQDREGQ